MSIKAQFQLLTLLILGCFLAFGLLTYQKINDIKVGGPMYTQVVQDKDLIADILPPPNYIIEAYLTVQMLANPRYVAEQAQLKDKLNTLIQDYQTRHQFWQQQQLTTELQDTFLNRANTPAQQFFSLAQGNFLQAVASGDPQRINSALNQLDGLYQEHRKYIDQTVTLATRHQTEIEASTQNNIHQAVVFLSLFLLMALIIVGGVSYRIQTRFIRGLNSARQHLHVIASGNLQQRHVTSHDELGALQQDINKTVTELTSLIQEIRQDAAQLTHRAAHLEQKNTEIVSNSSAQKTKIDELSTALLQISSTIQRLDNKAKSSSFEILSAEKNCTDSATDILATVDLVKHFVRDIQMTAAKVSVLSEKSGNIDAIVQTINSIAEQTNLLALNAAIEAARAGEQGRGFAVVADEIRGLAQRTASSTQEIAATIHEIRQDIEDSVHLMHTGLELADQSTQAVQHSQTSISSVEQTIHQVAERLQDVISGLHEQRHASDSVVDGIDAVLTLAGNNLEQTRSQEQIAIELTNLAGALQHSSDRFSLAS